MNQRTARQARRDQAIIRRVDVKFTPDFPSNWPMHDAAQATGGTTIVLYRLQKTTGVVVIAVVIVVVIGFGDDKKR